MEENDEQRRNDAEAEKRGKETLKKENKKRNKRQTLKQLWKKIPIKIRLIIIGITAGIIGIILLCAMAWYILQEIEIDFNNRMSIYQSRFQSSSRAISLVEYLFQFSHSGEPPQSEDGKFYKMYGDSAGWPTIGASDLQWKSNYTKFECKGKVLNGEGKEETVDNIKEYVDGFMADGPEGSYDNGTIASWNIYIEKELVDKIGGETAESHYQSVQSETEGLDLSQQQLYALTAISYNFGHLPERNGRTFVKAYEEGAALYEINSWQHMRYIWDNWWAYVGGQKSGHIPSRDAAFETFVQGIYDFTDSEAGEVFGRNYYIYYTQEQLDYLAAFLDPGESIPNKPVTRTPENESTIFKYRQNRYNSVIAGDLLTGAEAVHTKYEDEKWTYSLSGLIYGNIRGSMSHSKRITCCATFVSEALYVSGLLTEEEVNSYGYNSANGIHDYLKTLEGRFIEITSYNELEPGDVVFMEYQTKGRIGHVQIHAGDETWYNAGSTSAIQRDSPYKDTSYAKSKFVCAMRPIANGNHTK